MLITTSLFDNRVLYSEPVKYIARLRDVKNIMEVAIALLAASRRIPSGEKGGIGQSWTSSSTEAERNSRETGEYWISSSSEVLLWDAHNVFRKVQTC